jgi:hypothetical protein
MHRPGCILYRSSSAKHEVHKHCPRCKEGVPCQPFKPLEDFDVPYDDYPPELKEDSPPTEAKREEPVPPKPA